ncbi:MAG: AAA family ATPase [Patescibacteria group bacterium]
MKRGLVIGKFYPPHKGHAFLITTALAQVDTLTVVICDNPAQKIPAETRAVWLREMVPGVKVRIVPDIPPPDDSKAWAKYTEAFLGYRPDVVFTSEAYGDAYAQFLGARHVAVDPARRQVPISATDIRRDPFGHWNFLSPCVQAYFARRVCILGAESTGTTTMARALAVHYATSWVPEFGRLYSEAKFHTQPQPAWVSTEFAFIAREQNRLEDWLARCCSGLLVCDTNALATELWEERYLGSTSAAVAALATGRRYDHYFLTDVDIPFVQDGLRDGEHIRHDMHKRFVTVLQQRNVPHTLLSGPHEQRLAQAIAVCDTVLRAPNTLSP